MRSPGLLLGRDPTLFLMKSTFTFLKILAKVYDKDFLEKTVEFCFG